MDTIDVFKNKYNAFLLENGDGPRYDLVNDYMFVIEGMNNVGKFIEEKSKLTKHKKIANNMLIEIDSCSLLEILKLRGNMKWIAQGEETGSV